MLKITAKLMDGRTVAKYRLVDTEDGAEIVVDKNELVRQIGEAEAHGIQLVYGVKYRKAYKGTNGKENPASLVGDGISLKDIPSEQLNGSIYGKQPTMANPNYKPELDSKKTGRPSELSERPTRTIEERYDLIQWAVDGYSMDSVVQGCKNMIVLAKAHSRRFTIPPKEINRFDTLVGLSVDLFDTKTKLTHTVKVVRHPGSHSNRNTETWTVQIFVKAPVKHNSTSTENQKHELVIKTNEDGTVTRHWVLASPKKKMAETGQLILEEVLGKHNFKSNNLIEMTPAERVAVVCNLFHIVKNHVDTISSVAM